MACEHKIELWLGAQLLEREAKFTAFDSGQVASLSQSQSCLENGLSIDCTPVRTVVQTKEIMHGRHMTVSVDCGQGPCHVCVVNTPHT